MALARVGHSRVRSMPISFISSRRGSGSKKASIPGMAIILPKPVARFPKPPPPWVMS